MAAKLVGWFLERDGGKWERVCTGASLNECSGKLIRATRLRTTAHSRRFLTGGKHPEEVLRRYDRTGAPDTD